MNKFNTNSKYCIYDETHDDYLYTEKWIDFIMNILEKEKLTLNQIKEIYNKGEKLDINEYE